MHIWWARKPLAASRATVYSALINEPYSEEERSGSLKIIALAVEYGGTEVEHAPERLVPVLPEAQGNRAALACSRAQSATETSVPVHRRGGREREGAHGAALHAVTAARALLFVDPGLEKGIQVEAPFSAHPGDALHGSACLLYTSDAADA